MDQLWHKVISFLYHETFAEECVLAELCHLSRSQMIPYLIEWGKQKKLVSCDCPELQTVLWGIASAGVRWIRKEGWTPYKGVIWHTSGTYSVTTLFHKIAVQRLVVVSLSQGGALLQTARGLGMARAVPDAILDIRGEKIALEYERVLKAKTRYPEIFSERLQDIKSGCYDRVVWVLPDSSLRDRLSEIIYGLEWVPVSGSWVRIRPIEHHSKIAILLEEDWSAFVFMSSHFNGENLS